MSNIQPQETYSSDNRKEHTSRCPGRKEEYWKAYICGVVIDDPVVIIIVIVAIIRIDGRIPLNGLPRSPEAMRSSAYVMQVFPFLTPYNLRNFQTLKF